MPSPSIISQVSPPQKQPRYGSIFNARFFTGLHTNRNPLRGPLGVIYEEFYKIGNTDVLIDGANVELTTRLTLARRPGNPVFSTAVLLDTPDTFYPFHEFTPSAGSGIGSPGVGNVPTIKVIADTPSATYSLGSTSANTVLIMTKGNMASNPFMRGGQISGFGTGASAPAQGQYGVYDNAVSGKVSLSVVKDTTVPTGFQTKLQISTSASGPSPGLGGFSYGLIAGNGTINSDTYIAGNTYVVNLIANIPAGFTLNFNNGSLGTGGVATFITSQAGSGNWTTYQVKVTTGTGLAASNAFPFFYLAGAAPVTWFVAALTVVDQALAGQTYVQAITNTLYMGDGVEQAKWNDTVISPPPQPILNQTSGGANAQTTYFVTTTYQNALDTKQGVGETVQSVEANFVVSASNFLVVTAPPLVSGASGWNVYISTSTGTETRQNTAVLSLGSSFTLNVALIAGLSPLTVSTAQYVTQWGITAPSAAPSPTITQQGTFISTAATVFDGASAYVSTALSYGSSTGLAIFGHQPIMWEIIFKTSASGNAQVLMGVSQDQTGNALAASDYWLWLDATGHLTAGTNDISHGGGVIKTISSTAAYNDGQTHHAVMSYVTHGQHNDSAVSIFVDGKLVTSIAPLTAGRPAWFDSGCFIRIGDGQNNSKPIWPFGNGFFNGTLSRAAFYYGNQITSSYAQGIASNHYAALVNSGSSSYDTAVLADNPSSYWKLNETSGTVANDTQGRNQGTYQGSVTLNQTTTVFNGTWVASTVYATNATIIDSNGNLQKATTGGTSGTIQPAWNSSISGTTQDNTVVWTNQGPAGLSPTSPSGYIWGFSYKNSVTQHYSSMSTRSNATGPGKALFVSLSGPGSIDPQVDKIAIFRTADGGGTLLQLAEIANPPSGNWAYTDNNADTVLNPLIVAPEGGVNNPPPAGATVPVLHMGRIWVAVGGTVYASGGPDTNPGSGYEAFPGITFTFPGVVNRMEPISSGLLIFTTDDIWIIQGGPAATGNGAFFANIFLSGFGLLSYNAFDNHGSLFYFYTADRKLVSLDPTSGVSQIGFPIGDQFYTNFDPTKTYVTFHIAGDQDKALFVADGKTGWFRCNPQQAPDWGTTGPVWSPKANIVGGAKAVVSVETSPGNRQVLVGPTTPGNILARDSSFSTFTDGGSNYDAFATIGSIVLANFGEMAELSFIACDFIKLGTSPHVLVLIDEISGAFEDLSGYVISDPPLLYGVTGQPNSLYSNRYSFSQSINGQAPQPAWCRHIQIKIDFLNDTLQNELLTMGIFGRRWVER